MALATCLARASSKRLLRQSMCDSLCSLYRLGSPNRTIQHMRWKPYQHAMVSELLQVAIKCVGDELQSPCELPSAFGAPVNTEQASANEGQPVSAHGGQEGRVGDHQGQRPGFRCDGGGAPMQGRPMPVSNKSAIASCDSNSTSSCAIWFPLAVKNRAVEVPTKLRSRRQRGTVRPEACLQNQESERLPSTVSKACELTPVTMCQLPIKAGACKPSQTKYLFLEAHTCSI